MASTAEDVPVPFFKKGRRGRPATARKQRSESPPPHAANANANATATALPVPSSSSSSSSSQVVLPPRRQAGNLLSAGTKRKRQQGAEGDNNNNNDDDREGEREGPDVKWTAAGSHVHAALEILQGDEAEALLAKRRRAEGEDQGGAGAGAGEGEGEDDGLYRGQKAYKTHIRKNQEVPKAMRVGPQRASNSSTIRTVTIVDYQPDVCKDYKETGYCGYGDTCKFLHDRGTYLAGWQLDKLAANPRKGEGSATNSDSDSDSDSEVPFACLLCRKAYTDPVVTRCGHYFCSACAIRRFARTPKCAACGAPTGGIFNRADKVIAKLNKAKAKGGADGQDEGAGEDGSGGGGGGVPIEGLAQGSGDEGSEDSDG